MGYFEAFAYVLSAALLPVNVGAAPVGDLDNTFQESVGANGSVWSIAVDSSQRILIGGEFTSYGGIPRNRLARLNSDGSLDTTFDPGSGANGPVQSLALQADGRVVIAGTFSVFQGASRNGVARVNTDGTLDSSFNPGVGANLSIVFALALQPDEKPVLGGHFTQFGGATSPRIARALATGAKDPTFSSSFNNTVYSLAIQPDGRILVGGIGIFHRINPNGSYDLALGIPPFDEVNSIKVQPNGRILAAGYTPSGSGFIFRRLPNGQLDSSFSSNANGPVWSLGLLIDGKVLVGGAFSTVAGTARGNLALLNADGSIDPSFAATPGANSPVLAVAVQPDGRILIGGTFTTYNGISRGRVARVLPASTCYVDQDGDGYGGAPAAVITPCGTSYSVFGGDCDDSRATVFPGAPEICDGLDNNCNGGLDEGLVFTTYYRDADGDGFGNPLLPLAACSPPTGYAFNSLDCDDSIPSVYTGAPELCDGVDNDCDGQIDQTFVQSYCTSGTSVAGCRPTVSGVGAPSSSSNDSFSVVVSQVPGQRMGVVFYGFGPSNAVWAVNSTSYVCVLPPQQRMGASNSGGTAGICDGVISVDFNAFVRSNPTALGVPFSPGTGIYAQAWYRDPGAPKGTNLSNGLRYTICN